MRIRRILVGFLVGTAVLMPGVLTAQGLMVSGYADFEAVVDNINSDDSDFYLDAHHFNLIFLGTIGENLFASAEVEYEHSGDEIKLEYGYLTYTGLPNISINAGKFIVPFGRFNRDLHPTWINKMPGRPHGFKDILPQTYSDTGLWLVGAAPFGAGNRFTADAWAINGLMGDDGGGIRDMRGADREKRTGARDDNKALGARLGMEFAPAGFDVGASVYSGNYSNDDAQQLNLRLLGVDAAYRYLDLEVRGEWISASQETTAGDLDKSGGYFQVAYLIDRIEPVIRYSTRNMPGSSADANRTGVGVSFYLSSTSAVRAAYYINSEKTGFETENNGLIFQFTTSF